MSWQKERNQKTRELLQHLKDIELKLAKALEALGDISRGYGRKDYNGNLSKEKLASDTLIEISKMKQREKPTIWWL